MASTDVTGPNAAYVAQLLEDYLDAPASVPPEWRRIFEESERASRRRPPTDDGRAGNGAPPPVATAPVARPSRRARGAQATPSLLGAVAAAMALVKAYRMHGHLAARLDPLGSEPMGDPALDETRLVPALTPELQARIPAGLLRLYVPGDTLLEALPRLREVYMGSSAYEIEHISDHAERVWLRKAIESGRFRVPLEPERRDAPPAAAGPGRGLRAVPAPLVPRPEAVLARGARRARSRCSTRRSSSAPRAARTRSSIGMAHRGRLNALVHTVGRSYESILREFEGERSYDALVVDPEGGSGDVKYHLPASGTRVTAAGRDRGDDRAEPEPPRGGRPGRRGVDARRADRPLAAAPGLHDPTVALPVLIHGDAAFAGQGVVAETLNLQSLEGYSTGGTLHLITNNQVGFTTDPTESRSTRYSSDLAKGFDIPIVHVNADDPEAALSAVALALAYRAEFGHDFVDRPRRLPPLRPQRAGRGGVHAAADGRADRAAADGARAVRRAARRRGRRRRRARPTAIVDEVTATLRAAHDRLRASIAEPPAPPPEPAVDHRHRPTSVETAVRRERLRALNEQLLAVPEGFTVNPKLARQLERRRDTIEDGRDRLGPGRGARLRVAARGRDPDPPLGPGHRARDVLAPSPRAPRPRRRARRRRRSSTCRAPTPRSRSTTRRSPSTRRSASSTATPVAAPDALVLWEAQFGDFVNGAQIVIDQFIVAGRSKWNQTSRLTLLLPHGYEGNGPEHSSARLERFLQLGAQDNIRVVQLHDGGPVLPPAPPAGARRRRATARRDDPEGPAPAEAGLVDARGALRRGVPARARRSRGRATTTSSGSSSARGSSTTTSSATRLHEDVARRRGRPRSSSCTRSPSTRSRRFSAAIRASARSSGPRRSRRTWARGGRSATGSRRPCAPRSAESLQYVGRTWKASPSEGYPTAHQREQDRIVRMALGVAA